MAGAVNNGAGITSFQSCPLQFGLNRPANVLSHCPRRLKLCKASLKQVELLPLPPPDQLIFSLPGTGLEETSLALKTLLDPVELCKLDIPLQELVPKGQCPPSNINLEITKNVDKEKRAISVRKHRFLNNSSFECYRQARRISIINSLLEYETGNICSISIVLDPWVSKITRVDLSIVIKELGARKRFLLALQVFDWMCQQKGQLRPQRHVYSLILGILCREGLTKEAKHVFRSMSGQGVNMIYSYNAMISGYFCAGSYKKAWRMYKSMRAEGIDPDEITFNTLMNGLIQSGSPSSKCEELLSDMRSSGLNPNIRTYNTLIKSFGKEGLFQKAEKLLKEMKALHVEPDLITYNTMISMYARLRMVKEGLQIFKAIKESGLQADTITYTCLMQLLELRRKHLKAINLFKEMKDIGCQPDLMAYCLILHVYGRSGQLEEAEKLMEEMQIAGYQPNLVTWTSLIQAYARLGRLKEASSFLQQMEASGTHADVHLFNIMMGAYCRKGLLEEAAGLFRRMQANNIVPDEASYVILANGYWGLGKVNEAKMMHNLMIEAGYSTSELDHVALSQLSKFKSSYTDQYEPSPHGKQYTARSGRNQVENSLIF